jgi:1-deoxy-D-xylulose-5-phosphate reductoisomerase
MVAIKRISILGVTGSIGTQTLEVIAAHPERFQLVAMTAQSHVEALIVVARRLRPTHAVIGDASLYGALKEGLEGTGIQVSAGSDALCDAASLPADLVVNGIVGAAGLKPAWSALAQGTTLAIANKECLVCAGELLMRHAAAHGARLLPVDSEHNAIFQLLGLQEGVAFSHITLTASGGPFRESSLAEMRVVTPMQAVRHPNWQMGAKISVDSATLMNKGLEVIEAAHLFALPEDRIAVLVHPESVVHGMVHYADGSVHALLSPPDMRTPIAHALAWPERIAAPVTPLDLARMGALHFAEVDATRFPALKVARAALRAGGTAPLILNAANEVAVEAFLQNGLGFLEIVPLVESTLAAMPARQAETLETVLELDAEARRVATGLLAKVAA